MNKQMLINILLVLSALALSLLIPSYTGFLHVLFALPATGHGFSHLAPVSAASDTCITAAHPFTPPLANFYTRRYTRSICGSAQSPGFHCSTGRSSCRTAGRCERVSA